MRIVLLGEAFGQIQWQGNAHLYLYGHYFPKIDSLYSTVIMSYWNKLGFLLKIDSLYSMVIMTLISMHVKQFSSIFLFKYHITTTPMATLLNYTLATFHVRDTIKVYNIVKLVLKKFLITYCDVSMCKVVD